MGDDALFREDVKVTMAESGLYDFLMKVVTVTGAVKEEGQPGHGEKETKKEKEEKKPMQGALWSLILLPSASLTNDVPVPQPSTP